MARHAIKGGDHVVAYPRLQIVSRFGKSSINRYIPQSLASGGGLIVRTG